MTIGVEHRMAWVRLADGREAVLSWMCGLSFTLYGKGSITTRRCRHWGLR